MYEVKIIGVSMNYAVTVHSVEITPINMHVFGEWEEAGVPRELFPKNKFE